MKDLRQLGAHPVTPAAEKCEVVRQIHAADKAREKAMQELEAMRRCYNPPPFNPDDFKSNEANCPTSVAPSQVVAGVVPNEPNLSPSATRRSLGISRLEPDPSQSNSMPNEPNLRPIGSFPLHRSYRSGEGEGEDARGGERCADSPLVNEPNSRPLGFLAIAKPQSLPNEPNLSTSAARGSLGLSRPRL